MSYLPSVRYGISKENDAIVAYENKTNKKCVKAGLVVHDNLSFIACSPDRYVDDNGIIEVKCCYSCKWQTIDLKKIDYLDNRGHIRCTHPYYFQIQGLLGITKKDWCDSVIFTEKDLYIEQNIIFFDNMCHVLKRFYYFTYLPCLLFPTKQFDIDILRWRTVSDVKLLTSGLVNKIAEYSNIDSMFKEMHFSDFSSLKGENWLTTFCREYLTSPVKYPL